MPDTPLLIRLTGRLQRIQLCVAAIALLIMMVATVADVALRYLFNHPISGTYDLVESALVVFVFNGLAAVFLNRQNIVIDLIDNFSGRRAVRVLTRFADLLSLAMLAILFWAMTGPARQAFDYGDRKQELGLPLWILWAIALIGIAGAAVCAFAAFARGDSPRNHGTER